MLYRTTLVLALLLSAGCVTVRQRPAAPPATATRQDAAVVLPTAHAHPAPAR